MPMLKTLDGYGSCSNIDDYLAFGKRGEGHEAAVERYLMGDGTRALAFGHSPDLPDSQHGWHEAMDAARKAWGKDRPPAWFTEKFPDRKWRTYYHFIISPSPADHASSEDVAWLARSWLEAEWPSAQGYQWIYSVHDDNGARAMHAHVVLNAVNISTGNKVQISRRKSDRLAATLQEIAGERGMAQLESLPSRRAAIRRGEERTRQWARRTAAERGLAARGERSWVAEIRQAIDEAVEAEADWAGFRARVERAGIDIEFSRRGIGYRHPGIDGNRPKVLGETLGTDYTEDGVLARLAGGLDASGGGNAPARAEGPGRAVARNRLATAMSSVGWRRRSTRQAQLIANALAFIREEGVASVPELSRLVDEARETREELAGRLRTIRAAALGAAEARDRAMAMESARQELKAMPSGPWPKETRDRRAALVERITDAQEFCRSRLAASGEWLAENGLAGEGEARQAEAILLECRSRAGELASEAAAAAARLEEALQASKAVDVVLGNPISELHRTGGARLSLARRRTSTTVRRPPQTPRFDSAESARLRALAAARRVDRNDILPARSPVRGQVAATAGKDGVETEKDVRWDPRGSVAAIRR